MISRQHMLDGIAYLEKGDYHTALFHFNHALELRAATPWQDDVESAWLLSAAWMNRSDSLRFLCKFPEAIDSLNHAIDTMQYVPLDRNPSYVNRLILAWINRATLSAEMQQPAEAEISFSNAAQLLISWGETTTPDRAFIASMFHTNRARFQLDQENPIAGWKDVHIAVNFLKNLPPSDAVTEASIKARGILCRALAMLLDEPGGIQLEKDWIATATDLNEEALGMARSSNDHSPWIADLVRYGAKIYRVCQPHFLGEYLKEWLAPGSPLAENTFLIQEMQHELQLAKANVEQITRQRLNDTPFVRKAIQTIQSLQLAERELALQSP